MPMQLASLVARVLALKSHKDTLQLRGETNITNTHYAH